MKNRVYRGNMCVCDGQHWYFPCKINDCRHKTIYLFGKTVFWDNKFNIHLKKTTFFNMPAHLIVQVAHSLAEHLCFLVFYLCVFIKF